MSFQYAYLVFNLIYFFIWLGLFLYRRDLRHKMLIMSFLVAPLGPISQLFYLRDYWRPEIFTGWSIGIEDFLWGFFIGGIASVIYEEIFGKRYAKRHLKRHKFWMLMFFIYGIAGMVIGSVILGYNSIYVSFAILIVAAAYIAFFRHDLIKDAFISGALLGCLMFLAYLLFFPMFPGILQKWWMLDNLTGFLIAGVPLEELMWAFGWGMVAAPMYEFINGLTFKKR
jgi:hypothetical protein